MYNPRSHGAHTDGVYTTHSQPHLGHARQAPAQRLGAGTCIRGHFTSQVPVVEPQARPRPSEHPAQRTVAALVRVRRAEEKVEWSPEPLDSSPLLQPTVKPSGLPQVAAASLRNGARKLAAPRCGAWSGRVGPQQPHVLSAGLWKSTHSLAEARNPAEPKRLGGSNPFPKVWGTQRAARSPGASRLWLNPRLL